MYKIKCPACKSPIVKRNGTKNGIQMFKCNVCNRQFCLKHDSIPSDKKLWDLYLNGKQTIADIAKLIRVSESSVKRRLHLIKQTWVPPCLKDRHGVIHIDVTYFGRNSRVIAVMEESSGQVLNMAFTRHEKVSDFVGAISEIEAGGYVVEGVILDGNIKVITTLAARFRAQMCQFHMALIIRRKLTKNLKLTAGIELQEIMRHLPEVSEEDFVAEFERWHAKWKGFLNETTVLPEGKSSTLIRELEAPLPV